MQIYLKVLVKLTNVAFFALLLVSVLLTMDN